MNPRTHDALRKALARADDVDRSGRLRAVLHLVRCAGSTAIEAIVGLRLDDLLLDRRSVLEARASLPKGSERAPRFPHGAFRAGPQLIELDEEARREVELYLGRRARLTRIRLRRRTDKEGDWYAEVVAGGGRRIASLRTTNRAEAVRRMARKRRRVRQLARDADFGWVFPQLGYPGYPIRPGQVRIWLNEAIGIQAPGSVHQGPPEGRPLFRNSARRRRGRSTSGGRERGADREP